MNKAGDQFTVPLGPQARQGNTAFAVSVALLVLRLSLGWTFIYAGSGKVFGAFGGFGMEKFTEAIVKMGMPGFLPATAWATMAAYGELIGGICVLLGLLSRLGTIPLIVSMCVAIAKVLGPNGFGGKFENGAFQQGYMINVALMTMCAVVLIAGPGMISVDAILFRRGLWARGPQPLSEPVRRG